jgi:hypothetical protein
MLTWKFCSSPLSIGPINTEDGLVPHSNLGRFNLGTIVHASFSGYHKRTSYFARKHAEHCGNVELLFCFPTFLVTGFPA